MVWLRYLVIALLVLSTGCAVRHIPDNLAEGILSNDDLDMVGDGLPTYLLTLDGLVLTYPNSTALLGTAAELNSAYAGVFVTDDSRVRKLTSKALNLADRAACSEVKALCGLRNVRATEAETSIETVTRKRHAPALYLLGSTWAGYIQAHSDDWNAVADLAKVQRLLEQQTRVAPGHNHGMGELYLAVLSSLLPPALGGQPEVAQRYFEQALHYSDNQNLIAKVYYAQNYARMVFDQELHDRLLNEVLSADPVADTLTLQNTYAQRLARELLRSGEHYF
ncbi:MAG: TRAP transporter TatT component family protein [Natronospirillum sp.]